MRLLQLRRFHVGTAVTVIDRLCFLQVSDAVLNEGSMKHVGVKEAQLYSPF